MLLFLFASKVCRQIWTGYEVCIFHGNQNTLQRVSCIVLFLPVLQSNDFYYSLTVFNEVQRTSCYNCNRVAFSLVATFCIMQFHFGSQCMVLAVCIIQITCVFFLSMCVYVCFCCLWLVQILDVNFNFTSFRYRSDAKPFSLVYFVATEAHRQSHVNIIHLDFITFLLSIHSEIDVILIIQPALRTPTTNNRFSVNKLLPER